MKLSTRYLAAACAVLTSGLVCGADRPTATAIKPHGLFTDNMVLQRDLPIAVYGTAGSNAGGTVEVVLDKDSRQAQVGEQGRWRAEFPARPAGGPFTLSVSGADRTIALSNVMVGEVWITSGQSNMEMPLKDVQDSTNEIAAADHPELRLYQVSKAVSPVPKDDVVGAWTPCTTQSVQRFSAVAYYFGRDLSRKLGVTVGLINAPWFGTMAESWTTAETLNADPVLAPILRRYWVPIPDFAQAWKYYEQGQFFVTTNVHDKMDFARNWTAYEKALTAWHQAHPEARAAFHQDQGNEGLNWGWAKPDFDDGAWKPMNLPRLWKGTIDVNGAVWFRKQVMIPDTWAGRDLVLSLGAVYDCDTTYFNGRQIGATGGNGRPAYMIPRIYRVPGGQVQAGAAVIAVRVFDERDGGGFDCIPKGMVLAVAGTDATNEAVSLAGPWKYSIERPLDPNSLKPFPAGMPYPPHLRYDQPNQLPGSLYNGMIHPLLGYGFAGAAWYQGESNTDRGEQYRALLPAMIGDWRRGAGRDFTFLIVQLPTGGPVWAEVREAQAMTARRVPKTGLAVIMDIPDGDLHPKIKLPVGQRLALAALSVAYGQTNVASGPIYRSMTIEGKTIRLRFDSVGGGLAVRTPAPPTPPELKGFTLAGADGRFYAAKARIEGDSVVLSTDYVPAPLAARYAFSGYTAEANFSNAEGLPCGSFRTDDWAVETTGRR